MRICHVITKPELGGAQLSTKNLLTQLPKDKYEIFAITSSRGELREEFFRIACVKTILLPFLTRLINPIADIFSFISIYFIYSCYRFDLIHTHSSKAGIIGRWAARLARVPIIIHTVHGWSFNDYQPAFLRRFFIFLERMTARFTTKIICVSKKDIETGIRYKIASKEKFIFIKYGIELAELRRAPRNDFRKRNELGVANNDPIVTMISCLKPQKAPLDYVRASIEVYREMPDINFLLIGDGPLKRKCKRLLSKTPLNGRFILTGWRRDIKEVLDITDILVLTSKWEGMPITLIEALSKGILVIATNVGGTAELIEDGKNGYLLKPGLPNEVALRVLEILRDKERSISIRKKAKSSIDDSFSLAQMVSKIDRLYRSLG